MNKSSFNFILTVINIGLTLYTRDNFFMFLTFFTFANGVLCLKIESVLEKNNDNEKDKK